MGLSKRAILRQAWEREGMDGVWREGNRLGVKPQTIRYYISRWRREANVIGAKVRLAETVAADR